MQKNQVYHQENLYRELVESTNSIILRWDMKGTIIFMNQYGLNLFGFSAEELFGRNVMGTIVPEQESGGRDLALMIEDIIRHPKKYRLNKNENRCRDGSTLWIQWSNRPILDKSGHCSEMLSVGIDVTSLEMTRQQLEDNEIRFQALYETSHDAILILQDGFFTCCNLKAEKLFGCSRNEIIGKTPLDFSCDRQPDGASAEEMHRSNIKRVLAGKRVCFDWRYKRKSSEEREAEVNLNSIRTGTMDYIQISVRDTTERRKLEQELRQHQKVEAIGTLAGGIAHDFNNILTAIMGFTEIALHKLGPDSPVTDELRQVRTASKRARDLIRQILTYSRRSPQTKQPVQIILVVKEAARLLRSSVPSTVEIRQQLASESFVNADPTQIHQVVMNLCTNAFHAMEHGEGVLTLSLDEVNGREISDSNPHHSSGTYIRLAIKDTGTGMSPEVMSKAFDPYFTTKAQTKGSGMGLAVVHGIVDSHGGTIKIDSKPGQGSTFTVFLPITAAVCALEENAAKEITEGKAEAGRQIMFVDDEASLRDLTAEFLVGRGYRVRTFADGWKAWEAFTAAPKEWDLIITDQTMPHLTGIELIRKIRSYPSNIPILLSTGYSAAYNPDEMERLGITGLLQKPSSLDRLLDRVQQGLKGCQNSKERQAAA